MVTAGLAGLNRYPDGPGRALRRALAERHGVGPDEVVLGNGSCELILLAGQALLDPGTTVIHAGPVVRALPAPRRGRRGRGAAGAAGRGRRPRPRRHGGGGRRARPPGHRLQPEQPDGRLPGGRRDRALPRRAARGPGRPGRRGLLRVRGPPRRRPHDVARPRAAQPAGDAHLQQGPRPLRPAGRLRRRRGGLGRGPGQGAPALQHQRARPGGGAGEPAPPRGARPAGAGDGRRAGPRGAGAYGKRLGLYPQPGQLYPGRAGGFGRRISECPRAAPAPRGDRARRRTARMPRAAPGVHRHPGGEHGVPVGAGRGVPRRLRARPNQDGRHHDDRDAGGRDRASRSATSSSASRRSGARAHPSRGEFVTVIGAIGDDREIVASSSARGRARRREGRPDPQAVQAGLGRLPRHATTRSRSPAGASAAAPSA